MEQYFEALGAANVNAKRDTTPLRELAVQNIRDCEDNLRRFRVEERSISNWIHFIHALYVPYMLSVFLLKEVYYSLDESDAKCDVEREMCLADERRTDISDYLKNPHLKAQAVLSDIARAARERGKRAGERAVRYHFEGRIFLPLHYADQFSGVDAMHSEGSGTQIAYEGLSAGHKMCLEEARKYTETLTKTGQSHGAERVDAVSDS